ncbi:MAG: hypothetical protein KDK97_15025 [Verrucomicrobiales bacterium]|nr:hypothetical protein [Verrucomicrobiales bacterium]
MKARILTLITLSLCSIAPAEEKPFASFIDLPWRYVIGGRAEGMWLNSEATGERLTAAKMDYRVFTLDGEASPITAGKASPDADVCPDVWMQSVTPEPEDRKPAIGVSATWNPMPRKAKVADTTQEVYLQAVRELLIGNGIAKPQVKIQQILRIDLDGDDESEVIIAATHYTKIDELLSAKPGDYSFVAMRRVVRGKVQTQIIGGEFYPKADENGAPNTYEVAGLLDLDGDGKLEVIIRTAYYEGGGTQVWQLSKDKLVHVLSVDCGV